MKNKLRKIGLSENEATVYIILIKNGSSKAGDISKHASMDRSSTYNAVKSLIQKGLVSYVTIGKIKWFQSSNPKNLQTYLESKLDTAKEIVPELDTLRKSNKLKENVRLFRGNKGIKTVMNDILENAKENLFFGSEGQFSKNMPLYSRQFQDKMKKKGIVVKSIIRSNRKQEIENKKTNVKRIPMGVESPVVTNIYEDKIAILIWSEEPEAILIENKKAADAYKDFFNYVWKKADKN